MTSAAIRNALLTWPRATLTGMPLTLPHVGLVLLAAEPTLLAGSAAPTGLAWSAGPTGLPGSAAPTGPGRPARARTSARRPARRTPPRSHRSRRYGPGRRPAPWCHPQVEGRCGLGRRTADGGPCNGAA